MDSGTFKTLPDCEFTVTLRKDLGEIIPYVGTGIPLKQAHKVEIARQFKKMLKFGIIQPSTSDWAHDVFAVGKKTGDVRIVFDFRPINSVTESNVYPLPNTTKLMHKFRGKKWITSIDMKGGYWHIPVRKCDRKYLAFRFNDRLYEWCRMPFGPKQSPSYFQYTMNRIFDQLCPGFVIVYLDDISIVSDTWQEHKKHLTRVFAVLEKYGIRVRADKCIWAKRETEFLGFIINRYGIKPTHKYKQKVLKVEKPKDKNEKRFLG